MVPAFANLQIKKIEHDVKEFFPTHPIFFINSIEISAEK
jgi:hypothetical protein